MTPDLSYELEGEGERRRCAKIMLGMEIKIKIKRVTIAVTEVPDMGYPATNT